MLQKSAMYCGQHCTFLLIQLDILNTIAEYTFRYLIFFALL